MQPSRYHYIRCCMTWTMSVWSRHFKLCSLLNRCSLGAQQLEQMELMWHYSANIALALCSAVLFRTAKHLVFIKQHQSTAAHWNVARMSDATKNCEPTALQIVPSHGGKIDISTDHTANEEYVTSSCSLFSPCMHLKMRVLYSLWWVIANCT